MEGSRPEDAPTGGAARRRGGLATAEVVTAVVVSALLFSIAVPVFSSLTGTVRLREVTLGVASDVRLLRSAALDEGKETRVELDVKGKRYRLVQGDLPRGSTAWKEFRPWKSLGAEADWATGPECNGQKATEIVFGADGSSEGGVVCIKDPSGAGSLRVVVASRTGRVSVE